MGARPLGHIHEFVWLKCTGHTCRLHASYPTLLSAWLKRATCDHSLIYKSKKETTLVTLAKALVRDRSLYIKEKRDNIGIVGKISCKNMLSLRIKIFTLNKQPLKDSSSCLYLNLPNLILCCCDCRQALA